ncbi:DUF1444 family protein [Xylanivirga thermophila]|uniref:DUF1444 family protein n=1 Tax=Xylanivirga thermophila TaxID=2496273 RepID=UPI00101DADCD|nr:DUF1444 family protein [Xylanivirga thermophila]
MLTTKEFIEKLINDLNHEFTKAFKYGDDIVIEWDAAKMNIPIETIFNEYQLDEDYEETLHTYKGIIRKILGQHKFKIDFDNIFPLLKKSDFAKDSELSFYNEEAFEDINTFFVSDMGEVFRFILTSDEVNLEKVKEKAWDNLNTITNPLIKLSEFRDIYTFKYATDYNASLVLSSEFQKQIIRRVGSDYIFMISSSTTLVIASYQPEHIEILESLVEIDRDPNKVSNKVYRCTNGIYQIVSE